MGKTDRACAVSDRAEFVGVISEGQRSAQSVRNISEVVASIVSQRVHVAAAILDLRQLP